MNCAEGLVLTSWCHPSRPHGWWNAGSARACDRSASTPGAAGTSAKCCASATAEQVRTLLAKGIGSLRCPLRSHPRILPAPPPGPKARFAAAESPRRPVRVEACGGIKTTFSRGDPVSQGPWPLGPLRFPTPGPSGFASGTRQTHSAGLADGGGYRS